jgi:hypothetical protein
VASRTGCPGISRRIAAPCTQVTVSRNTNPMLAYSENDLLWYPLCSNRIPGAPRSAARSITSCISRLPTPWF